MSERGEELARRVETVRFRPVRFKEGYALGPVDDLLDEVAAAFRDDRPVAPLVEGITFPIVRFREGYHRIDVDAFLHELRSGSLR